MNRVKYAVHQTPRQYMMMATRIVLAAKTLHQIIIPTKCQMYNSKDKPNDLQKETSVKQPVSTTKSTETENSYASLITAVTKHYKGLKQKQN